MEIRKAMLSDVDDISPLNCMLMKHHEKIDKYWAVKEDAQKRAVRFLKMTIRSPKGMVFVAEDGGKIIGYALGYLKKLPPISKMDQVGELCDCFVLERYRRRGIGKKLSAELFKWFRSKGMKYAELNVDVRNTPGLKAWKNFGFEELTLRMKRKV